MNRIFCLLLGFVMASCVDAGGPKVTAPVFDITALLNAQLDALATRKTSLEKEAGVNHSTSSTTLVPSQEFWTRELEIFRSLDAINRETVKYRAEGPLDDPQSNLLIRRYTHPDAPLASLLVYYQDDLRRVRKVEGEVQERTLLYFARRRLTLWFEEDRGQPVLNQYEIRGFQKASLRDSVHFFVRGKVTW